MTTHTHPVHEAARHGPPRVRTRAAAGALLLGAAAFGAPRAADAQVLQRFALRAEVGAGTMISDYQRNTDPQQYGGNRLGFDSVAVNATVRLAFTLYGPLAVQASFANWFFPSSTQDTGRIMAFEGGLRFEPRIGSAGRLFVDANAGYALTGPLERAELNAGLGFEFDITRAFALGPVVRVGDVLQADVTIPNGTTYPFDALYWAAGLSAALRVPEPRPEPPRAPDLLDDDCDHVVNDDDQCRLVNPGDRPDPSRRGCPLPDGDGDAVLDYQDICPQEPAGNFPDENRRGCPDPDNDDDGVLNAADECPLVPMGRYPLRGHEGCPDPHPLAEIRGGRIEINERIEFDTNSWDINATGTYTDANRVQQPLAQRNRQVLDAVVAILQRTPEIRVLEVQGHTDHLCRSCANGIGEPGDRLLPRAAVSPLTGRPYDRTARGFNLYLSDQRANAIRTYLMEQGHIGADRLRAVGRGMQDPLPGNTPDMNNATPNRGLTREQLQANRRVEFHITDANWREPPPPTPPPTEVAPHPYPPLSPLPALPQTPCRVRPEDRNGGAS